MLNGACLWYYFFYHIQKLFAVIHLQRNNPLLVLDLNSLFAWVYLSCKNFCSSLTKIMFIILLSINVLVPHAFGSQTLDWAYLFRS